MAKQVVIIGGGIIGLSSAMYLVREGYAVTVIDKSDMEDGCSYGNAGYVCPSHFVPLAAPGIVQQGFKWMLNSRSPFYVQPSLNRTLINWGLKFMKSANAANVERSAIPLRDIALLSKGLYEQWGTEVGIDLAYEQKGMLEVFKTEANAHHGAHSVKEAQQLGLEAELLDAATLRAMEPLLADDVKGAVYFKCDAQLYPNKMMAGLKAWLLEKGVQFVKQQEVTRFVVEGNRIAKLVTPVGEYAADEVVLATGTWSGELARKLQLNIPMVGGRGYSVTMDKGDYEVSRSVILSEARVAISPMDGNKIRFGGTMEITDIKTPPRMNRVEGLLASVKAYYPSFEVPMPSADKVWYGFRPCSADGLPHIGKTSRYSNLVVATGHSMLGVSLGAGTGKLVEELISDKKTSMDIAPFAVERF